MDETTSDSPDRVILAAHLARFGQEHVLRFWDELDAQSRARLAGQVSGLDLQLVDQLYHRADESLDWAELARRAEPPPALRLEERAAGNARFSAEEARDCGRAALTSGEVGVLLTAGGQGTRLRFDHPKGMFPIGPLSGASLLQIHLEKARAAERRYGPPVPVYLMTSPATHREQTTFLAEHGRFGLPAKNMVIFGQGQMPAVDAASGKLLLVAKDQLFFSPDGHGGAVAALARSALKHMRLHGIRHLFYLQVDNPLVPICDEEFVGYHLLAESELTSMAVSKLTPQDKLGNFVAIDGRVQIIEYSDFPAEVAERRNPDGSLMFWAGSIAVHVLSVDFLERMLQLKDALPFHVARKKVPYVDESGRLVQPAQPNALKFERFIFDLLPHAEHAVVVEYPERDVFAPLKNAPGAERDTPEYVRQFMSDQHCRWLTAAGVKVADGVPVEISPLWALDAAGVATRSDRPQSIIKPTYLRDEL